MLLYIWNKFYVLHVGLLRLRAKSLSDQVPEFLSCRFHIRNLGLSGTSAFDSMPISYLTKHTVLRNFEVRPSSHSTLRVSHKSNSFGSRVFSCLSGFSCVSQFQAFALASHEAGVRTAAESKSGQSLLTHY